MIIRFIIGIGRHIRDAFRNFFRNFGLSLSALASINITLIVVSASILAGMNFNAFANVIESDVTIIAFINHEVEDVQIVNIVETLESDERTNVVEYFTKQEELDKIASNMPNIEGIARQYEGEENPLYNTLHIQATDVRVINDLVADMESTGDYFEVKYSTDVVDKVINFFDYARLIVVVIIGMLLLVTVFIIYNTIRITIYTRSVHVEIMKLIGASNYHITMPYIYEGILIGLFGSILPIVFTVFGYKYFYQEYSDSVLITSYFDLVSPYPNTYYIAIGLLAIGLFVGVFGSALSIRRFVRK